MNNWPEAQKPFYVEHGDNPLFTIEADIGKKEHEQPLLYKEWKGQREATWMAQYVSSRKRDGFYVVSTVDPNLAWTRPKNYKVNFFL